MFYLLEFLSNHQPATWKVEISGEPGLELDQQVLDNVYKFTTRGGGPPRIYRPSKIKIKFIHPIPDDRMVFKRRVLIEKTNLNSRICEESSEPFAKLYWTFSYFNKRGMDSSLQYRPDLLLYKYGKDEIQLKKWHLKNVAVISFSVEQFSMPSVENCSMEVIPESFFTFD